MRISVSIRYKVLALVVSVVAVAMASYLLLAIDLFTADKIAYVYDLNSTLAKTLGAETETALASLNDRLQYFGNSVTAGHNDGPGGQPVSSEIVDEAATRLFGREHDVLSLEIWRLNEGGDPVRWVHWQDEARLHAVNMAPEDLTAALEATPLPWELLSSQSTLLHNRSLAPDVALLSVAIRVPSAQEVVVAHLRPDRLLRVFGRTEIYTAYLVDRRGNVLVHPDPNLVLAHSNLAANPLVRDTMTQKPRRGARSFADAAGQEFIGAYLRLDDTLGVSLMIQVPKAAALAAANDLVRKSILFAIGIFFVALLASVFFSRRLTGPIRRLERATRTLAKGEFDTSVAASSKDEMGSLAQAFNQMAEELLQRDGELEESHQRLLQSSKLAVVGEMAAGVSHEVKNPLGSIRGLAQLGLEVDSQEEVRGYLEMIETETTRAVEILEKVLNFSRKQTAALESLELNDVVNAGIRLVRHQLQTQSIILNVSLGQDLPAILGNANQLQQVLLNLMINAQHAMENDTGRKELSAATSRRPDGAVCISVTDSGCGMDEETQTKLFRAFFTTKDTGTGLGLSVSNRIVKAHGGQIEVESQIGEGTTFRVVIPAAAEGGTGEEVTSEAMT